VHAPAATAGLDDVEFDVPIRDVSGDAALLPRLRSAAAGQRRGLTVPLFPVGGVASADGRAVGAGHHVTPQCPRRWLRTPMRVGERFSTSEGSRAR
jgi:hypothetical protein